MFNLSCCPLSVHNILTLNKLSKIRVPSPSCVCGPSRHRQRPAFPKPRLVHWRWRLRSHRIKFHAVIAAVAAWDPGNQESWKKITSKVVNRACEESVILEKRRSVIKALQPVSSELRPHFAGICLPRIFQKRTRNHYGIGDRDFFTVREVG